MSDDSRQHAAYESRIHQLRLLFLQRAEEELSQLGTFMQQARAGDAGSAEAQQQLGRLIHRINGSGAMLGFAKVSGAAGRIEHIVRGSGHSALTATQWQEVETLMTQLAEAIQVAHRDLPA